MKTLMLMLAVASSYAYQIIPDKTRNYNQPVQNPLSLIWDTTNYFSGSFTYSDSESEIGGSPSSTNDYQYLIGSGKYHSEKFSIYGDFDYSQSETTFENSGNQTKSDTVDPTLYASTKFTENFGLSLGFDRFSYDSDTSTSTFETTVKTFSIGPSFNFDNIYLGFLYNYTKNESNQFSNTFNRSFDFPELDFQEFILASGYLIEDNNSIKGIELALSYQEGDKKEENGLEREVDERLRAQLNLLYSKDFYEVRTHLRHSLYESDSDTSDEYTTFDFDLDLEVHEKFFVLTGYYYLKASEEFSTTTVDDSTHIFTGGFGYRFEELQASIVYNYQDSVSENLSSNIETDTESNTFVFDVSYRF